MNNFANMTDSEIIMNNCPENVKEDWQNIIKIAGSKNVIFNHDWYEFSLKHKIGLDVTGKIGQSRVGFKNAPFDCVAFHQYGEFSNLSDNEVDYKNAQIAKSVLNLLQQEV